MNIATVLRVFKNSSLIMAQGEFKISRVFNNWKVARNARYHYYCIDNGISLYTRRNKKGKSVFVVIGEEVHRMRKKKPFKVLEKQLKYDYIVIQLFKGLKIFLFGLSTSIGDSGMGHPEYGTYHMSLSPNPWKGLKTIK